jgi:hypothetical protein
VTAAPLISSRFALGHDHSVAIAPSSTSGSSRPKRNDLVPVRRNEHIPLGIGWGVKGLNGVVELANEPSYLGEMFSSIEQVEPVRPNDFTGDEGEDLAALIVQTQGARGSAEADVMKVVEKRVNRWRPRTGWPSDGVSHANYLVDVSAGHFLADFASHDQKSHTWNGAYIKEPEEPMPTAAIVLWTLRAQQPGNPGESTFPAISHYRFGDGRVVESRMFRFDTAAVRDFSPAPTACDRRLDPAGQRRGHVTFATA